MTKPSSSTRRKALDLYLKEIKKIEPLSPQEEVALAQQAKTGDTIAFQKLVTHNLRFVVAMAKKFQGQGVPFEDLINEGNLGLIRAVNTFDETRGFKFISYAVWWITQRMRTAIQKTGRVVRLPSHITESMGKLYRKSLELEQEFEREPTTEEMAEISGLIVTKLDGSAKGGILLSLAEKFSLPVHAIGVGEKIEDLQSFEAQEFAKSLMGLEK